MWLWANTAHAELLRTLISSDTYRNKANQKSTRLWCPRFHQPEMMVMHMWTAKAAGHFHRHCSAWPVCSLIYYSNSPVIGTVSIIPSLQRRTWRTQRLTCSKSPSDSSAVSGCRNSKLLCSPFMSLGNKICKEKWCKKYRIWYHFLKA